MTAYFYRDKDGRIKQVNLHPAEYAEEAKKHRLYHSKEEARRAHR